MDENIKLIKFIRKIMIYMGLNLRWLWLTHTHVFVRRQLWVCRADEMGDFGFLFFVFDFDDVFIGSRFLFFPLGRFVSQTHAIVHYFSPLFFLVFFLDNFEYIRTCFHHALIIIAQMYTTKMGLCLSFKKEKENHREEDR